MNRIYALLLLTLLSASVARAQCTLSADAGSAIHFCAGDSATLGSSPGASGGTAPYVYTWGVIQLTSSFPVDPEDVLSDSTASNPTIYYTGLGDTLLMTLLVTDGEGCEARDTVMAVESRFTILTVELRDSVVLGDSVRLSTVALGGLPPYTYQWTPTDGLSDPTQLDTWASPNTDVVYQLLTTDSLGCTAVSSHKVFIIDTATSLPLAGRHLRSVYPNPAQTYFELSEPAEVPVRLFGLAGRLVRIYPTEATVYSVRDLPAGSYLVETQAGVLRQRLQVGTAPE